METAQQENQASTTVASAVAAALTPQQEALLTEYDFIVVLDASGSMTTEDTPNGKSRWAYLQETAGAFARDLGKLDSDGIDVVVFSGTGIDSHQGVQADKLDEIFAQRRPAGGTPLAEALTAGLKLAGKSAKKDFIAVFTDGVPDDPSAAAQVIINAANGINNDDELTILFIQVGRDRAATDYLKQLDDNLTAAKFDIVDAKTIAEVEQFPSTAALIAHAIND